MGYRQFLHRQFSTEKSQIVKKHLKKCSKSLVIREMQIEMIMTVPFTPTRMGKIIQGIAHAGEGV